MKAEIIAIGTELLLGETTDTNSYRLAGDLPLFGIDLQWISAVDDNQSRIVEVLKRAWGRSEVILTTGGLGPTGDDLTREAIAEMLGEKMEVSPALEKELRERFRGWSMAMPTSNLKQAALIPSAKAIPNTLGTAPGWWVEKNGRIIIAMPGPPNELEGMWQKDVRPKLQKLSKVVILRKTFKTFGLSEAAVGELVAPMFSAENPFLGIYAKPDGIHLRLVARAESQDSAKKLLAEGEAEIRRRVGEHIWGFDNDTMESAVTRLLVEKGLTLALMEDYSGGWLTASLTDIPESSRFFKGGVVANSNETKAAFGVKGEVIPRYGGVSPEAAQAMAEAAKTFLKADIGIGITGIDEAARPMGIVYVGITDGKTTKAVDRIRGKRRVTTAALFELRRLLIGK
ncbi:MAG: CinA family nicotinamide mononucleotide deamidase-related protein [Chloroflexota bacterium]